MLTNRLKVFVGGLLMALILGGWIHGSAVATFEGKTWKEALATVPCQNVTKDGKDLKISGTVIVDGNQFPSPTITKDDLMDPLEKRCFPRG
jgi:hypothetical protein